MTRYRIPLLFLFFISATTGGACSCDDPIILAPTPGACEPDFDCPAGSDGTLFTYRQGTCRVERCGTDSDCCPGQKCNLALGFCGSQLTDCTEDEECGEIPDQACIDYRGGQFCGYPNAGNVLSEADTQGCVADADCDGGRSCVGGRCVIFAPCEGGCSAGEVCEIDTNTCFPLPTDPGGTSLIEACNLSCEDGQMLVLSDPDTMNGEACCALECACATLPPVPAGEYGWHASIAALPDGGDRVAVSAYDAVYGDIVVAFFDEDGDQTRLEYVDGFPMDGALQGNPDGPRGGRFGPGPDMGEYSSIAIDEAGTIHVAYYDRSEGHLRYAQNSDGSWRPSVVDQTGHVGRYTSIALTPDGNPAIAYMMVEGTAEPDPTTRVGVKYAVARTPFPNSSQDWDLQVVDSVIKPVPLCNGGCNPGSVCVDIGVGPVCEDEVDGCTGCGPAQSCVIGSGGTPICADPISVSVLDGLIEGTGLFTDLTMTATGTPVIAYYDSIEGNLRLATGTVDGTFILRTLDGNDPVDPLDVGQHASVAVGPDGTIGVAYFDVTNADLVYFDVTRNDRQIVDDGVSPPDLRQVGADADLVYDADGEPAVAYQDPTRIDLLHARRAGSPPMWSQAVIRGAPATGSTDGTAAGFFACQVRIGNEAFIGSVDVSFDEDSTLDLELVVEVEPLD